MGTALDDRGPVAKSTWVEFDVTAALSGNGAISFVLTGPAKDAFAAYSRQTSGKAPQLVVIAG